MVPRAFAHDGARSRAFAVCPMRCAVRIGLDRGRLGGDLCRCAVGIGAGRVASDALCPCDSRGVCGMGSAVPLGLAGRAWSGWRCAVVTSGKGMVWVSLCHGDWWGERGLGVAVPW